MPRILHCAGKLRVAQAVLGSLKSRRAFGWPADSPLPVIDPAECAAHFGLGREAWEHAARWESGFYALVGSVRYDRSERRRRIDAARRAAEQIAAGTPPEDVGLPNLGLPVAVPIVSRAGRKTVVHEPPLRESPGSKNSTTP